MIMGGLWKLLYRLRGTFKIRYTVKYLYIYTIIPV